MTDAEYIARLEAENAALRARIKRYREVVEPGARVGRTVTDGQAAADFWWAWARQLAEVQDGKRVQTRAA